MHKTKFSVLLGCAILFNVPAEAQLSTNPWLEPNSEDAIAEVYRKNRNNSSPEFYNGDNTVLEERPTYAQLPEDNKNDNGVLSKVKNLFSKEETTHSTQPVETEAAPVKRRIISGGKKISRARPRSSTAAAESSGGFGDLGGSLGFSGGDFSNVARKVKRSVNSFTKKFK